MVVTLLLFKACSNSSLLFTVASPSAQTVVQSASAMTSASMVANIFFIFLTPGFLDFRSPLRFKLVKTPKQEYSCG
ncbi:MAG: hypothetical protein U0M81_03830 [Oscillospiraceae bacterium]